MTDTLLQTKLFIPPIRPNLVSRPRLTAQLDQGLHLGHKLTLISAPAGFGKTTLIADFGFRISELNPQSQTVEAKRPNPKLCWVSLDDGDNDLTLFLTYLVTALKAIDEHMGGRILAMLHSPQQPPIERILTALINDLSAVPANVALVLDDYHVIDEKTVHEALAFLLEHLPPNFHLVIATREDPALPLARYRARGQLIELRAIDLRFTTAEAAEFLNRVMGLNLSAENIAALETRTEGWIAGLQLAALSLQGQKDTTRLVNSFSASNRLILDYLIEEVLDQQPRDVQSFLTRTAILNRLTAPLCDALTGREDGQQTLQYLEQANLFVVPLDDERRWYRYHHLFADLLRRRLRQSTDPSKGAEGWRIVEFHKRASIWYEQNGLDSEAFHHAVAAGDIDDAARLAVGDEMPLHLRGALTPVLRWLESLPTAELDARPSLWVMYGSALLLAGRLTGIEDKLQAAEAALQSAELNDKTKFLLGLLASTRIILSVYALSTHPSAVEQKLQSAEAALQESEPEEKAQDLVGLVTPIRAGLMVNQRQVDTVIDQSRRALDYFPPDKLLFRISPTWFLGIAYHLQGDRPAAGRFYTEAISMSEALAADLITIPATIGLGQVQEVENQLYLAAGSYRRGLELGTDPPPSFACEAHLGLARIAYEWNDLDAARQHWQQSVELARQIENRDDIVSCELFLARLKLAAGDQAGASAVLARAGEFARRHNFPHLLPEVAAAQVLVLLHQGDLAAAAHLAQTYDLPLSQARVELAQGNPSAALAVLEPLRRQAQAKGWQDEQLKIMVLQALALYAQGEKETAVQLLAEALTLAEPGGFMRLFVDEGPPMAHLLHEAATRKISPAYTAKLLAAFPIPPSELPIPNSEFRTPHSEFVEPLSPRELEVLHLIAEGLTNQQIASRLYLSLHTVKVHARNIYGKLDVKNRTQAVARARSLGLLPPI